MVCRLLRFDSQGVPRHSGWTCGGYSPAWRGREKGTRSRRCGDGRRMRGIKLPSLAEIHFPGNDVLLCPKQEARFLTATTSTGSGSMRPKRNIRLPAPYLRRIWLDPSRHCRPRGLSVLPSFPARRLRAEFRPADHHHRRRKRHRQIHASGRNSRARRL